MKEKIDQRVMLTRNLLKNALVQLMQEQHISKISVRALCEIAGINRSTFYMHYTDPYDLLNKVEQEVLDNLKRYLYKEDFINNRTISVQILTKILYYGKDNSALFKALLNENCDYAFQKDIMKLAQFISAGSNPPLNERTQKYMETFGIMGCISVMQEWIQSNMEDTPEMMAEFIVQILYKGMNSFIKSGT